MLTAAQQNALAEWRYLWEAAAYQHPVTGHRCRGKIHVLREDDWSRTVCGRHTAAIGGATRGPETVEASTCQACRHSLAAQAHAVVQQAQWAAQQQREQAEWRQRYTTYLTTPEWRARRSRVLARAAHRCEGCREQPATQVHHLTYRRLGREMLFDLVAICDGCHASIHEQQQ